MEHETFDVLTKLQSFGLFVGQGGASHKRIKANVTCSDPEFLFFLGGRAGPRQTARKQPQQRFVFFISLFTVYRGGQIDYQWFYFRGNYFS